MSDPQTVLRAGGILPLSAKPPTKKVKLDDYEARSYTHPGLDAPMIRLSASNVAHALDLEMELLGFTKPKKGVALGKVTPQKLGFPAWALVNDPKNARFALDVVADLKKAIRRMKSKPGHAKEQIDAIAQTLAGSVPHFLPSYYEEAARAFLDHDNRTYAGQYFEKARAAERTYALEVDPDLREESFVAFALAGALSVKSLSNFAAELEGAEGVAAYTRVCVRRTTGGLPPSASTLKDLKALAKSAGTKPEDAQLAFVRGILESPAFAAAPAGFFKAAKKALATLAKESAEHRRLLLDLFPRAVRVEDWLGMLASWRALDALPDASVEGQSELGVAGWFNRLTGRGQIGARVIELLERCADRVRAEGAAIVAGGGWSLHPDLVERLLALELPMTRVRPGRWRDEPLDFSNLDDWVGEALSDDLPLIAAHEELRPPFVQSIASLSSYEFGNFETRIDVCPALGGMVEEGLTLRLGRILDGGLPDLEEGVGYVENLPDGFFARYPAIHDAVARLDAARSLARTLRIGVFDELRWAKFESLRENELKSKDGIEMFRQYPHVVLWNQKRVIVLDADDAVVLDHKAKLKKGEKVDKAFFVEGDLAVLVAEGWRTKEAYWASAPDARFPASAVYRHDGAQLPDGTLLLGRRRVRKGDRRFDSEGWALWDGETAYAWTEGAPDEKPTWQVWDPMTGERGEKRGPAFLTRPTEPDAKSDAKTGTYSGFVLRIDVPEGAPLRTQDGRIGARWFEPDNDDDELRFKTVEDICGFAGRYRGWRDVSAVYVAPESDETRVLASSYGGAEIFDLEGRQGTDDEYAYRHGKAPFFAMSLLTRYRTRDAATSRRLRAMEGADVAALVEAAGTEAARKVSLSDDTLKAHAPVRDAIAALLPELTDEGLASAIAGIAHGSGQLHHRLEEVRAKLGERPEPGAARKVVALPKRSVGHEALPRVLGDLAWPFPNYPHDKPTMLSEVAELRGRFDTLPSDGLVEWGPHIWQLGLGHGSAALYRLCCVPKKHAADREHIADWVRALVAAGFEGERAASVRMAFRKTNTQKINQDSWRPTWKVLGDNGVFVWQLGYGDAAHYTFIEHAPDGDFQIVKRASDDISGPGWATEARIDEVLAHVEAHGPLPLEDAAAIVSERTGLSPAEALLFAAVDLSLNPFKRAKKGAKAAYETFDKNPFLQPWPTHQMHSMRFGTAIWMAGDWKELWDAEVLAERVCAALSLDHPELPKLSAEDDLVGDALVKVAPAVNWLARLADARPKSKPLVPELQLDRDRYFDDEDYQEKGPGFDSPEAFVRAFTTAIWRAPLGSAFVRSVPAIVRELRARMKHPAFFLHVYSDLHWDDDDDDDFAKEKERTRKFFAQFDPKKTPGELLRGKRAKKDPLRMPFGDGRIMTQAEDWNVPVWVHVDAILANDARVKVPGIWENLEKEAEEVKFLFGGFADGYVALVKKLGGGEGCAGDPRVSAPKVVDRVAKKFEVSKDAAALYLQLLGLPHPADRTVQSVCGWTKKKREGFAAELVAKSLVLEAKRAGAGRSHFVPGAWITNGVPRPVEDYKRAVLGWAGEGPRPFDGEVVLQAPDAFYESLWDRIRGGDLPRFEDPPKRKKKAAKKKAKKA